MIRYAISGLALLILTACGAPKARHYYTLTYPATERLVDTPHDVVVRIKPVTLRDTYRRNELVFRPDAHEIRFYRGHRWSERPKKMITTLLRDHVRRSGLFKTVTERIGKIPPDYTLTAEIEAIEVAEAGTSRFARLALVYTFTRFTDGAVVWRHEIDARRPVAAGSTRATVRQLSHILASETDTALQRLDKYLKDPVSYAAQQTKESPVELLASPDTLVPSRDNPLNNHPQLLADTTSVPVGYGAIFIPAASKGGIREPHVLVFDGKREIADSRMGQRIVLKPGRYEVRFGSGAVQQLISALVLVRDGMTTVVEPTRWATLDIAVVDRTFVPFRGTYELIRMDTREDLGIGFGADAQVGEQTRVWVLKPGLYKIIRAGGTYRDRVDFATVRILPGTHTNFTLVLEPDSGNFLGAGEALPIVGSATTERANWKLRGVAGGDVDLNRSDFQGEAKGFSFGIDVFFDGSAVYRDGPHVWATRLELEEGQIRPADEDNFRNLTDRLFFHTIYTYQLTPWFGPYIRTGLETKLLPRYRQFESETDVDILDGEGHVDRTLKDQTRVELGGSLSPMDFTEGAGGNFRLVRSNPLSVDLRMGLGGRQRLANGLLLFEETGHPTLQPEPDSGIIGIEGTVVGVGRVSRFISITTEFDGLQPFTDDKPIFTWRNQIGLRLISYISLNYRYNLVGRGEVDEAKGEVFKVRSEHDLQLRFSYTLF